jgi:hypothetical protein
MRQEAIADSGNPLSLPDQYPQYPQNCSRECFEDNDLFDP